MGHGNNDENSEHFKVFVSNIQPLIAIQAK